MEISVTFAIFYIGIFYVHEIKAMTTTLWTTQPTSTLSETTEELMTTQTEVETTITQSTSFSLTSSSTEITTTLPETTHSSTEKISTTTAGKMTTPPEPTTSTTEKLTSTTVTPTASSEKITTSTKVLPETTSSTEKLTSTTQTPTSTEKITSTENTSSDKPFVTQLSKSDKNGGVIAALGTIAGISLVANVLLSILLFRSCRRISNDNTTPMYANENVSKIDQSEMYTVLGNKEDGGTYQTLTHKNEVVYNNTNTNTCMRDHHLS